MSCVILYAEDEENDIFFLHHAFDQVSSPHALKAVPDGQDAIDYLAGKGDFSDRERYPLPTLVLLDINMPRKSGLEVLEWIRQQPQFRSLPVLILTSSSRPEDMDRARQLGADEYLFKPPNPADLVELVKSFHDRWLSQPTSPRRTPGSSPAAKQARRPKPDAARSSRRQRTAA